MRKDTARHFTGVPANAEHVAVDRGHVAYSTARGLFLDGERVVRQWDGFVPSRLLDVEPEDRPPAPDGGRR